MIGCSGVLMQGGVSPLWVCVGGGSRVVAQFVYGWGWRGRGVVRVLRLMASCRACAPSPVAVVVHDQTMRGECSAWLVRG